MHVGAEMCQKAGHSCLRLRLQSTCAQVARGTNGTRPCFLVLLEKAIEESKFQFVNSIDDETCVCVCVLIVMICSRTIQIPNNTLSGLIQVLSAGHHFYCFNDVSVASNAQSFVLGTMLP